MTVISDCLCEMMSDFHATSDSCALTILRQSYGRFEARARIGPAIWPHHDLLWIHRGAIRLRIEGTPWQDLEAPAGIWIPPGTRFDGIASNRRVTASITHFVMRVDSEGPRPRIADPALANLVQAMVELSQSYAAAEAPYPMRTRLLASILDALERAPLSISDSNRIDNAWRLAADRLSVISGIGDVSALIDLSESAFRAQHRKHHENPAGQYLIALRLDAAKHLLTTTNLPVKAIAGRVGYGHPESFFHAFRRNVGKTPLEYRRMSAPFA